MKRPDSNKGIVMDILRGGIDNLEGKLSATGGLSPDEQRQIRDLHQKLAKLNASNNEQVSPEVSSRVRKARQRGSNAERACAKATDGVVVGRSKVVEVGGEYVQVNCQQPPDVLSPPFFSFECKNTPIPKKISKAMSQSIANAPKGFTPLVWWYDRDTGETYIVMLKPDWISLHGGGK